MRLLCVLLFSLGIAQSSDFNKTYAVAGQVTSKKNVDFHRYRVEVRPSDRSQGTMTGWVQPDGNFQVDHVPEGNVEVCVTAENGDPVVSSWTTVPLHSSVTIALPESASDATDGPSGPVSVYRLQHQFPKAAQKALKKATAASHKGDTAEAAIWLKRALEADPDCAPALEQLGLFAMVRGEAAEAYRYLGRAAELDSSDSVYQRNAAIASYAMNRAEVAEGHARQALRLDPEDDRAHYVLALSLMRQQKDRQEVVRNLSAARDTFPKAGELLMQLQSGTEHPQE